MRDVVVIGAGLAGLAAAIRNSSLTVAPVWRRMFFTASSIVSLLPESSPSLLKFRSG